MARSDVSWQYRQLGFGDCGHVVSTWPQIDVLERVSKTTGLPGPASYVLCDACTRERYNISGEEEFIWVRLAKTQADPSVLKAVKKAPRKTRPVSPMQLLLQEEGVL